MKTNKIFLSVVMLLMIMGAVSGRGFAQSDDKRDPPPMGRIGEPHDGMIDDINKTPQERATMRADKMKLDLLLTDDQYKSVYNVLVTEITASMKLRNEGTDRETMRSEMMRIHEDADDQMKGILTADQYKLYKKQMKDMMKKPGDHDNHRGPMEKPKDHD
ncbi:MAG: hypothetical protein JST55_14435 [Bacteroidetes bacterium]|nr:hypothetical protein [Bacteroidota bacterium]